MSGATDIEKLWQPATFLERGVAVPFTTPTLAGTRARPANRGVDLVVPNPSGGRGVYILPWANLPHFCAPTLHDSLLCDRVAKLTAITPREIRHAARAIAAEGAAGRGARAAALAADKADAHERLMANYKLLQMLVKQLYGAVPPPAQLDRQAKAAIVSIAARLGRVTAEITNDIEMLATLFAALGIGAGADTARCGRLLSAIAQIQAHLRQVACLGRAESNAVALVMSTAEVTIQLGRRTLADAQARLQDLPALLAAWQLNPARVAAELTRAEWILDGWEQICLVWQLASADRWRAAVREMALMVPIIPAEAGEWWATRVDDAELERLRRSVQGYEDWRTGSLVIDLIARNEHMRALAA